MQNCLFNYGLQQEVVQLIWQKKHFLSFYSICDLIANLRSLNKIQRLKEVNLVIVLKKIVIQFLRF